MVNRHSTSSSHPTMTVPTIFHPHCLRGKVALITGGGSGICFEIARQFVLSGGCSGILLCGRRESFLRDACQLLQNELSALNSARSNNNKDDTTMNDVVIIKYQVCDVRLPEQCIAAMDACRQHFNGQLDILINGAAGNFLSPAATLSPKGFATVLSIDALGTFNMSHAAYPLLRQKRQDHDDDDAIIINISATLQYGATWWQCHASAAKAAIDSLTRSLALEWGGSTVSSERSIRVVGIAPGPIANTPGTTKLAPGLNANDVSTMVQDGIPLGRMGRAYEIGHAAIFLCCCKFITGHTLVVDGGEWLYRQPLIPRDMVTDLSRKVEAKSRSQKPSTVVSRAAQSSL